MVKSNFDDPGVAGLLVMRATTFILGIWGHFVEKVVEKLGFLLKFCSSGSQKFKEMLLEKIFVPA